MGSWCAVHRAISHQRPSSGDMACAIARPQAGVTCSRNRWFGEKTPGCRVSLTRGVEILGAESEFEQTFGEQLV